MVVNLTKEDLLSGTTSVNAVTQPQTTAQPSNIVKTGNNMLDGLNQLVNSVNSALTNIRALKENAEKFNKQPQQQIINQQSQQQPKQEVKQMQQMNKNDTVPSIIVTANYDELFNLIDNVIIPKLNEYGEKKISELISTYQNNKFLISPFIKKYADDYLLKLIKIDFAK